MKTFVYRLLQIILILLILGSIAHAFYQSSLPPKKSEEVSDKVGEIIEEIIPPETKPGEYIQKNLRKLAHFSEFFLIGLCAALHTVIYYRKTGGFVSLFPFGIIVALLDETVQIFSGRGASVKDIWIDTLGYSSAAAAVLAVFLVLLFVKRIRAR